MAKKASTSGKGKSGGKAAKAAPKSSKANGARNTPAATKALPKATLPKGAVPQCMYYQDEDGKDQEIRVFDVVQLHDPSGKMPWRGQGGKGFVTSPAVYGHLDVKLDLNATGLNIGSDAASVVAFVDQFVTTCTYWTPDTGYGRQHYTDEGVMHDIGLQRLPVQGLGKMAAQALNELAQRASQVGSGSEEAKEAQMVIKAVTAFGNGRTATIRDSKRAQAYRTIENDGGEVVLQSKAAAAASA